MQIEINEAELKEWAVNQIRKRMGDRINTLMREWDWNGYMRDAVDRVVREKVTDEAVKCLMKNIDKGDVVRTVSDRIATEITDSLQNYHFAKEGIDIKRVLDACCGSRMFYFDKQNPDVIYADNRELETTLCDGRTLLIKPDVQMDFRDMPYKDNTFKVVVFDPPHLIHAGTGSWLANKYGILPLDWPKYLRAGFNECMRVLEPNGLLIFKWNEDQIGLNEVLKVFERKPLLGDQRGKTRWLVFIK